MTATVIKAGAALKQPHAPAFNFDDLASQGDRYVADIRAQAAKIIADARQEAETIRSEAEKQGRQAAVAAAEKVLDEKVGKQMATLLPALRKAVEGVEQAKAAWLAEWEKNVVHLASRIAARVVRREVAAEPQIAMVLLREGLEFALGAGKLTIRLNPSDHAALGGQAARLAGEFRRLAPADIVADSTITPGGCRLETEFGSIDQTVEAQLTRIEEELRG
jgi:flagellar assembly protein FliH